MKNIYINGNISILMLLMGSVIVSLLAGATVLQSRIQAYLLAQRSIDRCLYRFLEARQTRLNSISSHNKTLKNLNRTYQALEALKLAPIVGQAATPGIRAAQLGIEGYARAITLLQEVLVRTEQLSPTTLLQCGVPLEGLTPLWFQRDPSVGPINKFPLLRTNQVSSQAVVAVKQWLPSYPHSVASRARCFGSKTLELDHFQISFNTHTLLLSNR